MFSLKRLMWGWTVRKRVRMFFFFPEVKWRHSLFVSSFLFLFFFFQGHTDGPARTRRPINFVVLHFFDVLPSRHFRRLSLNPCYTSSFLFIPFFFFFCSVLILLLTVALPCPPWTSANEAELPFSIRAPACSFTPRLLWGWRIQDPISVISNLKSGTPTQIPGAGDTDETLAEKVKGSTKSTGVFLRPALPGLGAADVQELSCNHSA